MPSSFPCITMIREWLWKKTQIEKKLNSPPRSDILRDFQNLEYRFIIPKSLAWLAENREEEGEEEHRQLKSVISFTQTQKGIFSKCLNYIRKSQSKQDHSLSVAKTWKVKQLPKNDAWRVFFRDMLWNLYNLLNLALRSAHKVMQDS